jgi:hypothetical protein
MKTILALSLLVAAATSAAAQDAGSSRSKEKSWDASLPSRHFSDDRSRLVTVAPGDGMSYLFDTTVGDESDPRSQGRLLGAGVASVKFVDGGDAGAKSLTQIDLTFSDGSAAVVDPNGTREILLTGGSAVLRALDGSAAPVALSQKATSVLLTDRPGRDAAGESEPVLNEIVVLQKDGTSAVFDAEGRPASATGSNDLQRLIESSAVRGLNIPFW